jgi:glycosyltransferase involved in cell wall biosynthesis
MAESQVFYSPSAYESFGIAAAEALCSGCSVVSHRSVSMASFEWFVSEKSGTLAKVDSVDAHVEALSAELETWGNGWRNAQDISRTWCQRLHANHVAKHVVAICEKKFQGSSF